MADNKDNVPDNMPEESKPLDEEELKAIEELKARFKEEDRVGVPDVVYVRYVRGYWKEQNREECTYDNLAKALAWRKELNVDSILNAELEKEEKWLELMPHDFHGYGKRQHVIYYDRICYTNPYDLTKYFTDKEIQIHHIQMQETVDWLKAEKAREIGGMNYRTLIIIDCEDLSRHHLANREVLNSVFAIDQNYYPETVYKIFIINAPFIFKMIWTIVKPMLHPLTQAKFQILGGQSDYLPKLKECIDDDQIPKYLGGSCSCCEAVPLPKQYRTKLERNRKWRAERLAKQTTK